MNGYQLAKLISQAGGGLESRKRMQKLVFMLQAAGCQLDADFYLHRYGPYSTDVANVTDQMVRLSVLDESESDNRKRGQQYSYRVSSRGAEQLRQLDADSSRAAKAREIERFQPLAARLLQRPMWELEVASTIVFYQQMHHDWETAKRRAFQFKGVDPESPIARQMEALAREVLTAKNAGGTPQTA